MNISGIILSDPNDCNGCPCLNTIFGTAFCGYFKCKLDVDFHDGILYKVSRLKQCKSILKE